MNLFMRRIGAKSISTGSFPPKPSFGADNEGQRGIALQHEPAFHRTRGMPVTGSPEEVNTVRPGPAGIATDCDNAPGVDRGVECR